VPNQNKKKGVCREYGHNDGINIPIIATLNSNQELLKRKNDIHILDTPRLLQLKAKNNVKIKA
jgi:hypothetical protein